MSPTVRQARPQDAAAVAAIWRAGWEDAHRGHVPDALVAARTDASFATRAAERVADTPVAIAGDGSVAGFVMVAGDELEQVYVAREQRGTGAARALLAAAERRIHAAGHASAWLAVVAGNARARRFYAREGWTDAGAFDYAAAGPDGPISVPCHRYTKRLG